MSVVEELIAALGTVCAGLADRRTGLRRDGDDNMADIGLSAFSLFFTGSPSFLAHQRALERGQGQGRSNCQSLFGISAIPSSNYTRSMLDGASPAAFDGLFMRAIETTGPLSRFHCLGGWVLIARDGSEYFRSREIQCSPCSPRRRRDGVLPRLPGRQHGRIGSPTGAAPAAGIHCPTGRGAEAALRA